MSVHHNHHCCHSLEKALTLAEEHCEREGARFTDARREVFSILWKSPTALSAKNIMAALGSDQPPIVYRALDFLLKYNLVHHVASMNAFTACCRIGEPHIGALMICEACQSVTEVELEEQAFEASAARASFTVRRGYVELLGVCATCSNS